MSPESPTTRQENSESLAPRPAPLARSILARTSWVQRALSPWVRRWLAAAPWATPEHGAGRAAALAVANTQWLVKRVQRIVERQALSPLAGAAPVTELPLVGPRPSAPAAGPTPEPAPEPDSEATGFKPFDSFTDFVKAVEKARARQYHAERVAPASNLAPDARGEHTRPPKLSASARQLPKSREQGPYSKRFTSFADFTQALEETRQRESQLAAQRSAAPGTAAPGTAAPGTAAQDVAQGAPTPRIRPVSRIEELPPRISTVSDQSPALDAEQAALGAERAAELPDEPAQVEPRAAPPFTQPAEPLEHYPAAEPSLDMEVEARGETPSPQPAMEGVPKERTTTPRVEPPSPTERATEALASKPDLTTLRAPAARPAPTLTAPPVQRQAIGVAPGPAAAIESHAAPQAPAPIEPDIETEPGRSETPLVPLERQAAAAESAPTTRWVQRAIEPPIEPPLPRSATPLARPDLPVARRPETEPQPAPRPSAAIEPRVVERGANDEPLPVQRETPRPATLSEPHATEAELASSAERAGEPAIEPRAAMTGAQAPAPVELPVEPPRSATRPLMPLAPSERQTTEAKPAPIEPPVEMPPAQHEMPAAQLQAAGVELAPTTRWEQRAIESPIESQPIRRETPRLAAPADQVAESEPLEPAVKPTVKPALPPSATPPPTRPDAQLDRPAALAERQVTESRSENLAEILEPLQGSRPVEPPVEIPPSATRHATPATLSERQVIEAGTAPRPTAAIEPPIELPPSVRPDTRMVALERQALEVEPPLPSTSPPAQTERPALRAPSERQGAEAGLVPTAAIESHIEPPLPSALPRSATRPDARIERPVAQRQAMPGVETPRLAMQQPMAAVEPIEPFAVGREANAEIPSTRPGTRIEPPLAPSERQTLEPEPAAALSSTRPASDLPDFTLGAQVFARRAASQRLTTAQPPALPLKQPALRVPAAQPGAVSDTAAPAMLPTALGTTPFALRSTPLASEGGVATVIQRTPIETPAIPSAIPSGEGFIQRVESTPPQVTAPTQAQGPDLDDLARKIYPLIKRMLSIERERRAL